MDAAVPSLPVAHSSASLQIGTRVKAERLCFNTALNDAEAVITVFDSDKQRWGVKLDSIDGLKSFRRDNLKVQVAASPMQGKIKLCLYGQSCWRVGCRFRHDDEKTRAQTVAELWIARVRDVSGDSPPLMSAADIDARILKIDDQFQNLVFANRAPQDGSDTKLNFDEKCMHIEGNIEE